MDTTLPLEKEVRFAVVMYGGVSLAIYIHGVSQELYHLVRATARKVSDPGAYHHKNVKGVEVVYRKLGEYLKAKFVVDILSGTSAGGINAVYLAKALANDQEITELQRLWKEQGDIALLVNDKQSVRGVPGLKVAEKPSSLLNSNRMYFKLLDALYGMRSPNTSKKDRLSPYVNELDLFVTATDIDGLVLPIKIVGANTYEYRYRNVFHFRYSTAKAVGSSEMDEDDQVYWNDFSSENDPFLAFAARSTSSFPFAFEPIRLDDVQAVLKSGPFQQVYRYVPDKWSRFYKDYQRPGEDFPVRSFGDGGYLDNKPFSYATETLLRRRADLPVDRKLIYIDPDPEHPEEKENPRSVSSRPDALENVTAALLTLPRYETIRGDLQTIADRNEVIKRTNRIMEQIDYLSPFALKVKSWQLKGAQWAGRFLDEQTINQYGPSYPAYHQLRVESALDDLACAFSRAMGWDENGEQKKQLLILLQAWRREYYTTDPNDRKPSCRKNGLRRSENDILFRLDSRWRMRRLHFMQGLIDTLIAGLDS
ncbi:MAG: patatin-like protein, partial [Chloroflexi bacterium]|nr:patatin-like protein [Chloroflexota bacterium]